MFANHAWKVPLKISDFHLKLCLQISQNKSDQYQNRFWGFWFALLFRAVPHHTNQDPISPYQNQAKFFINWTKYVVESRIFFLKKYENVLLNHAWKISQKCYWDSLKITLKTFNFFLSTLSKVLLQINHKKLS